ncbi:DUF6993 domain-containing protein [Arthrobacter sp. zg-Y769]|uniref:DUF6993 domain-containing protein n=1 Tax=Arthrobacter sp. zg-Y769 TaxID=2894191 RepID=UPI001E51B660|nr:hypothetical protein [Arthrobacter sp. zg-Y769]MCC9204479.1 hypothetical protein [Arthrobacter sp. zg-Y769]
MSPRRRARQTPPAAAMAAVFLALAVGLSGCGSSGDRSTESAPAEPGAAESAPAEPGAAESAPGEPGAAESAPGDAPAAHAAVIDALESELGKLADSDSLPDGEAVAAAFAAAGFPAGSVEVSADRTPTGLEVDSIQAASVKDGDCIFGEVRDGSAYVTVLPVLSGGGCFVGN